MAHKSLFRSDVISRDESAFNAINEHINIACSEALLEIEIIPSALCPPGEPAVVRDGHAVGIPKALILQAYKHALQILFAPPRALAEHPIQSPSALNASAIILLTAPEHLTAANLRKRHLLALSTLKPSDPTAVHLALAAELHLLSSFLTSPLHRHTKSPTIWSHRRWLLKQFPSILCPRAGLSRSCTALDMELKTILQAAERHPRNYYAWSHLRFLVDVALPSSYPDVPPEHIAFDAVESVHAFCCSHPSDTSGWSALLYLLKVGRDTELALTIYRRTVEKAMDLRWRGEAVWVFLRTLVTDAACLRGGDRLEMLGVLKRWVENVRTSGAQGQMMEKGKEVGLKETEDGLIVLVTEKALQWVETNWVEDGKAILNVT